MSMLGARNILSALLIVTILIAMLGGIFSMGRMHDGEMGNCPFMGVTSLCNMSPLEHMTAWQNMLVYAAPQFGVLFILLLISLVLSRLINDLFVRMRYRPWRVFNVPKDVEIFDHLRLAFADGLIHPKVF